jgi:hypothetical protein
MGDRLGGALSVRRDDSVEADRTERGRAMRRDGPQGAVYSSKVGWDTETMRGKRSIRRRDSG